MSYDKDGLIGSYFKMLINDNITLHLTSGGGVFHASFHSSLRSLINFSYTTFIVLIHYNYDYLLKQCVFLEIVIINSKPQS